MLISKSFDKKCLHSCLTPFLRSFTVDNGSVTLSKYLGVNFINVKRTNFLYERCFGSFYYVHVTRKKLSKQCSYEKFARLTLVKWTAGITQGSVAKVITIKMKPNALNTFSSSS